MAIYSGFSHSKWWFSIAMLNYQRVGKMVGKMVFGKKNTKTSRKKPVVWWFLVRVFCKFSKCVKKCSNFACVLRKTSVSPAVGYNLDGKNVEIPDLKFCQRFSFHQQCHLHPQMKMWPASFSPSFSPTLSISELSWLSVFFVCRYQYRANVLPIWLIMTPNRAALALFFSFMPMLTVPHPPPASWT